MITYYKGDVIKAFIEHNDNALLMHGCNCFHTMGGGIAKQIKEQFPKAYQADLDTPYGDKKKLGSWSTYTLNSKDIGYVNNKHKIIMNAYTQFKFGTDKCHFNYDAFNFILISLKISSISSYVIFMPKIGSGLAGGDWNKIEEIMEQYDNLNVNVYEL